MAHFSQLSIGLIIKSTKIWSWQHDLVQSLITKQLIKVSQVHVIPSVPPKLPRSIAILHKLDSMVFQSVMTAFKVVELDLPSVQKGSYSESSDGEGVDLWINLSECMVDNELSKTARLGVLDSHFSESSCGCETNSANFGYFEFSRREKQCYFSVVLQHPNGSKYVLSESRPSLDEGSLSRNMNQYWGLLEASWIRVCQQLQMSTVGSIPNNEALIKNADRFECPEFSSFQAYQNLVLVLLEKITQKFFRKEQWVLLLHFRDQSVNEEIPLSFADYQKIMPPKDCFWADPFIVTKDGRHYVFFEELPYTTECGHLSCLEVFADGSHSEPRVILKKPYHLSYPNVFSHDGDYYMVPESGDAGLITLYRCKAFPYEWEQERVLIDNLHAYDTTLLEYQGKWWLFACVAAEAGMSGNEELHIFYADSLFSEIWEPHLLNPVISDASRARPAGQFFEREGELYRPSQDCAGSYGAGLNINRIKVLDKENYDEELIHCARPDWDPKLTALHTLNFNQHLVVADAMSIDGRFFSK